jgi:hypothetical protein
MFPLLQISVCCKETASAFLIFSESEELLQAERVAKNDMTIITILSLADESDHISSMSGFGRKADVQSGQNQRFKGPLSAISGHRTDIRQSTVQSFVSPGRMNSARKYTKISIELNSDQ